MSLRLTDTQYRQLRKEKSIKGGDRELVKARSSKDGLPRRFARLKAKRSRAEELWEFQGREIMQSIGICVARVPMVYEPFELPLPGGRKYTPDFLMVSANLEYLIVAVKGERSHKLAGYRDSRAALKECAELHPWARYFQADRKRGVWTIQEVKVEQKGP